MTNTIHDRRYFLIYRGQFLTDFGKRGLVTCLRRCISASPVISDRIWCQKTVFVECRVSHDRSRTLISELSQGTPETKIGLKWDLEVVISTRNTRDVLVIDTEPWFGSELQILTEKQRNVDLEFVQENPRFLMSTLFFFQSVTVRILTVFDDF